MAQNDGSAQPSSKGIKGFVAPVLGFLKRFKGPLQYLVGFTLLAYVIWKNWEGKQPDPDKPPMPGLKDLLEQTPNFVRRHAAGCDLFGWIA